MPHFRIAIPARYDATRLPGKPLRLLAGQPLIAHVYRQAIACGAAEVVIATDDRRIRTVAEGFGATVCMTARTHTSGTERIAEVAQQLGWPDDDIVVNLQGDEPCILPVLVRQVAVALAEHPDAGIATLCTRIDEPADLLNPNVVKVVLDAQSYALSFSRAPIPWHRDAFQQGITTFTQLPASITWLRHIGLYAYRVAVLRRYAHLATAPLEQAESLEQLRALWHGIRVFVAEAAEVPLPGVDTEADLARLAATWKD